MGTGDAQIIATKARSLRGEALAKSKNGATVRIGMTPGVDTVIQLCRDGRHRSQLRPFPATFLGSSEMTLAELALAYTIFPNGGWRAGTRRTFWNGSRKRTARVWQAQRDQAQRQRDQAGNRLRSALLPGRCAGIRHRARRRGRSLA